MKPGAPRRRRAAEPRSAETSPPEAAVRFFIPGAQDDPETAEARWQYFLAETPAAAASRRVYAMTYERGGARYEVTVG
jgi:hypothetical protein